MGSSRFLPLVIAGIVGLFVGWLFGPDVGDVEDVVATRADQVDAKIEEIKAPLGATQSAVASLDQRITAIATGVQAIGNPAAEIGALTPKVDAAVKAAGDSKAATDALTAQLAALQQKIDTMSASPAPAAASGGDAAGLAGKIGNTGAVLLAGQTAIFGDKRVTLASLEGDAAKLGAEGGAPSEVATGASIDLGNGCSVTLAGVVGPAAFLAPTGCSVGAAPAAAAAPAAEAPATPAPAAAPAAEAPAAPAPAPAAAPAPAPAAASAAAEAAAAPAAGGAQTISIGQAAAFGDKRLFLSRVSVADNTAFVFMPGGKRMEVKTDAPADLGDGCSVALVAIEGTTATFSGCGGEAAVQPAAAPAAPAAAPAASAPAPAPAPAPAEAAAAPAASPAPAAEAPAAAPAQTASAGGAGLGVGQTATFGDKRLFISRVTPEKVFVVVVGTGPAEVAPGASADLGGGCSAKLDGIQGNLASFSPVGC